MRVMMQQIIMSSGEQWTGHVTTTLTTVTLALCHVSIIGANVTPAPAPTNNTTLSCCG